MINRRHLVVATERLTVILIGICLVCFNVSYFKKSKSYPNMIRLVSKMTCNLFFSIEIWIIATSSGQNKVDETPCLLYYQCISCFGNLFIWGLENPCFSPDSLFGLHLVVLLFSLNMNLQCDHVLLLCISLSKQSGLQGNGGSLEEREV